MTSETAELVSAKFGPLIGQYVMTEQILQAVADVGAEDVDHAADLAERLTVITGHVVMTSDMVRALS